MNSMTNKIKNFFIEGHFSKILYVVFVALMVIALSMKVMFFVDEVWTYTLSNSTNVYLNETNNVKFNNPHQFFLNDMSVNNAHRFDYKMVWQNQMKDNHPPLYYSIVHTISSLFPGSFSIWYAGIVNIIFMIGVLFVSRKIIFLLSESKLLRKIFSIALVFSCGFISAVTLLRMYIVAMFFVTLSLYLFLKMLKKDKFTFKSFLPLIIVTYLGAMTHYYFLIYIVSISIVFGLILISQKKVKEFFVFAMSMIVSALISLMTFPKMIHHLFFGHRGAQAVDNLINNSNFLAHIKQYYQIINTQLFGGYFAYILIGLLLLLIAYSFITPPEKSIIKKATRKEKTQQYYILFIPCIVYFFAIAKIAPDQTDRYMFPIYSAIYIAIFYLTYDILKRHLNTKKTILLLSVIFSVITVSSFYQCKWPYLYRSNEKLLKQAENYKDVDCLIVYDARWRILSIFDEVSRYKSITFLSADKINEIPSLEIFHNKELILLLRTTNNNKHLKQILDSFPQLEKNIKLYSLGYGQTYHLELKDNSI